jgi:NTE family protein
MGAGLLASMPTTSQARAGGSRARPRTAVCFGSGSLHGYAHIGAVRAFENLGFRPDLICGTSVGAIIGAFWAAGLNAREIEQAVLDNDRFEFKMPRFPMLGLGSLAMLASMINQVIGNLHIESLPTQYAAIATDLDTGELVRLTEGPVGQAVAASASIPIRYEPTLVNGRRLVDGALAEPVPVLTARTLGADRVIAVDVAYRPYEEAVSGFTDVAFQMFHILVNRLIEEQITQADLAIRMDIHQISQGEDRYSSLIAAGEHAVYEQRCALSNLLTA